MYFVPFFKITYDYHIWLASATAAKSHQLCPTLCDPIDGSSPGSPISGILQARTLEWVAIAFSSYLACLLVNCFLFGITLFVVCRPFNDALSDQCEVVPHCSFELPFSNS